MTTTFSGIEESQITTIQVYLKPRQCLLIGIKKPFSLFVLMLLLNYSSPVIYFIRLLDQVSKLALAFKINGVSTFGPLKSNVYYHLKLHEFLLN